MKGILLPLCGAIAAGAVGVLELIPAWIAIVIILIIVGARDFVLMALARGLPWAIVTQRIRGGILWGVWNKGNNVKIDRFEPIAGTISTKKHGSFNIMAERLFRIDGVPIGIAPDGVAYNVGFDHIALINELKKRGVSKVQDVADIDEYGQFLGWKDDKRIRDLQDKLEFNPNIGEPMDLGGFSDFYRYTTEAANPYHMDARIKIGISQGIGETSQKGPNYGLYALIGIGILAAVAIAFLFMGGQSDIVVNYPGGTNVIPGMIPL